MRRWPTLFTGFLFFTLSLSAPLAPAATDVDFILAPGGGISGTVRSESASPTDPGLAWLFVYVVEPSDNTVVNVAVTDDVGSYEITGLAPGDYWVYAASGSAYDFSGGGFVQLDVAGEFYPGSYGPSDAVAVTVNAGSTTGGIDFALGSGGSITGSVLSDGSPTPIPFTSVFAEPIGSQLPDTIAEDAYHVAVADDDGNYELKGLPPGSYRLHTQTSPFSPFADEYFNNTFTKDSATAVIVSDGLTTSGIDFSLAIGGAITGTVTNAANGQPLAGASVSALPVADPDLDSYSYLYPATTDSSGNYSVEGLPPGDYYVYVDFVSTGYDEFAPEFYPGAYVKSAATPVTVALGSIALDKDFDVAIGGAISGTVERADNGMPMEGVTVAIGVAADSVAHELVSAPSSFALTDADGSYRIAGLPPGQYLVGAAPQSGFSSSDTLPSYLRYFAGQFYDGSYDRGTADPVAVALANDSESIDFALEIGGVISGTVTREGDGAALQDIYITAFREPGLASDYYSALDFLLFGGTTVSGPSGSYELVGMPIGNMYVYAFDDQSAYLPEAYDNQSDFATATVVPVTDGTITTKSLTGMVVSDRDSTPVPGLVVSVLEASTTKLAGQTTTMADGSFSVDGLFPGSFRVLVNGGEAYSSEYYADAADVADSQIVEIGANDLTGIDFGLAAVNAVGPADTLMIILTILLEEP